VLDDLGHAEQTRAEQPGGTLSAAEQDRPATDFQAALQPDDIADIARVRLASGTLDFPTNRVELRTEGFDISLGEVRVLLDIRDRHGGYTTVSYVTVGC